MPESLWQNILGETKRLSSLKDFHGPSTIVIIGPKECGKSMLIRSLELNCTSSTSQSLDYGYTGIFHGDLRRSTMHVWCVNGDGRTSSIAWQLEKALNLDDQLENCVVLLTASADQSHEILPSLESQLGCLEKHLERLEKNFKAAEQNQGKPTDVPMNVDKFLKVPVILIVTKSDQIEKMMCTEDKDWVALLSLDLRKLALKRGTSLMFVSSSKDINVRPLKIHMEELIHGSESRLIPETQLHDSLFIPRGMEKESELKILQESLCRQKNNDFKDAEEFLTRESLGSPANCIVVPDWCSLECDETCEDDQVFLQLLQEEMSKPFIRELKVKFSEATHLSERDTTIPPSPPPPPSSSSASAASPSRRFSLTPRGRSTNSSRSGSLTQFFRTLLTNSPSRGASGWE